MSSPQSNFEEAKVIFIEFLKQKQLKLTRQRLTILERFLDQKHHVSAEDLFTEVRSKDQGIGYSTVYRTLKLLTESGIAKENNFRDGFVRYESAFNRDHHDHIICTKCNEIFEFENEEIEILQKKVAETLGFQIIDHQLEIYGVCNKYPDCPNLKENQ